jgi:hypothetical protein
MLSQDFFYHSSIRNYIVAFSHIINDIHVQRVTTDGTLVKDIKIPISYGQKDKLFYYLERNENIGRKIDTFLPRIDFEITGITPDPTRQRNPINNLSVIDGDEINETFSGVAYNFSFDVNLICNYLDDLYQALEQILANFNPDFTIKIDQIESLGISPNLKIILTGTELNINQDLTADDYRSCEATLTFDLQGYLFKPIGTYGKIRTVIADLINYDTEKVWSTLTSELQEDDETIVDSSVDYDQ